MYSFMCVFGLAGAYGQQLVVRRIPVATVHTVRIRGAQVRMRQRQARRGGQRAETRGIQPALGGRRHGWSGRRGPLGFHNLGPAQPGPRRVVVGRQRGDITPSRLARLTARRPARLATFFLFVLAVLLPIPKRIR